MAHYDPPGRVILLHNPLGLRIEFSIEFEGTLTLWYSPLAGKSLDYRERNFSNRDDHVSVFDRVTFPGLSEEAFTGCDYDPFHTVIHFGERSLHIMPHFSQPAVILWSSVAQNVDFKSTRADTVSLRTPSTFSVEHHDRWHDFEWTACVGNGSSSFIHQKIEQEGRSHYARAQLQPEDPLVILAGQSNCGNTRRAAQLAGQSVANLEKSVQAWVAKELQTGAIHLRGHETWEELHNVCRRHLLSARDSSGAIRAALNRIYYLIWVRDGAFIESGIAASGWGSGAGLWSKFLLTNPTEVNDPLCNGKAFLMLVNQLTKWEEDGFFYAVWSAFSAWTQFGQEPTKAELSVLEAAADWLERYCFDANTSLFGRSYACETPFYGSRDFGFDNAVGNPADTPAPRAENGKRVLLSYDVYINEICFSAYCMLAAMLPAGAASDRYLRKAMILQSRLRAWFNEELPPYGELLLEDGSRELAPPYGLDLTDYVWGLTAPPIPSHPHRMQKIRTRLLSDSPTRAEDYFLCAYFTLIGSLDSWSTDEDTLIKAIDNAVGQSVPPGTKLPMPYAIKEKLDVPDGDRWHDVRPQSFSAGTYLSCLSSLILRKLPFGLAVRSSSVAASISAYSYRGSLIDIEDKRAQPGPGLSVLVNGEPLLNTLQLPALELRGKKIHIELHPGEETGNPLLLESTVYLLDVSERAGEVFYRFEAYGWNTLRLAGTGYRVRIEADGPAGDTITPEVQEACDTFVSFWGRGIYLLSCSRRGTDVVGSILNESHYGTI